MADHEGDGEPESLCGGAGSWDEKFVAYARALLRAGGNPLLHWSHLELQRIFGISDVLTPQNALEIRQKANRLLAAGRISPRSLLEQFTVKVLCTTDDPVDDLHWHRAIAEEQKKGSTFQTKVLPAFRPDKALNTSDIAHGTSMSMSSAGLPVSTSMRILPCSRHSRNVTTTFTRWAAGFRTTRSSCRPMCRLRMRTSMPS